MTKQIENDVEVVVINGPEGCISTMSLEGFEAYQAELAAKDARHYRIMALTMLALCILSINGAVLYLAAVGTINWVWAAVICTTLAFVFKHELEN